MTAPMTEHAALLRVIQRLEKAGWAPRRVLSGGESTPVVTAEGAAEEAYQVEEGVIHFTRPTDTSPDWWMIVFCFNGTTGHDAVEVVADYHTGEFGDVIDAEIRAIEAEEQVAL